MTRDADRAPFAEHWTGKDWTGPVVEVIHAAFLLLLDAAQIFALFAIATGLDLLLESLQVKPIVIAGLHWDAAEIIKNFDYMLLVMFLMALIFRFGKILWTSR